MKTPPNADRQPLHHHLDPGLSLAMGDNPAQRVTPQMTPCLAPGGERHPTGAKQEDPITSPAPNTHCHYPQPHPHLSNGWLSPKGVRSAAGLEKAAAGSPSEADETTLLLSSSSSSHTADEGGDQDTGSVGVSRCGARPGLQNGTAIPAGLGLVGCACLHADVPAGRCQAEEETGRARPSSQNSAKQGPAVVERGEPVEALGERGTIVCPLPALAEPGTAVCSPSVAVLQVTAPAHGHQGLSENGFQHSQEPASLPHCLQNGHLPIQESAGHLQNHESAGRQLPNHDSAIISVNNDLIMTEAKTTPDLKAGAQTALHPHQAKTDLETSDYLIVITEAAQDTHKTANTQPDAEILHNVPSGANRPNHRVEKEKEHDKEEEEEQTKEENDDEEEEEEEENEDLEADDDEDDDEEDEDGEDENGGHKAADIDQGWAWVVLVSAFLGMTIFGTFTFSIGIFQAEILQVVEPDIQKTSWVGATHFSTLCMMGPFAGLIKNKLGSRKTVLMSSVIICFGMIAASLSVDVYQLILTYGVITGIGTGMALNPMFVCVSFYFERYRGFASGVIAAGAGAGMFVGGPIIRQLMEAYGLSGTFLIWGAVGLNIGVAGMVMRPSSLERRTARRALIMERAVLEQEEELEGAGEAGGKRCGGGGGMSMMDSALLASVSTLPSAGGYWGSVLGLSSFVVRGGGEKDGDTLTLQQSQIFLETPDIQDAIRSYSELSALSPEAMETAIRSTWLTRNFRSSQLSVGDSLDSASTGMRRFSPRLFRRSSRALDLEKGKEAEVVSLQEEGNWLSKTRFGGSCQAGMELVQILSNPGFSLYMFSGSMWIFGEAIVYAYLPTYAQEQGSSPFQAATLITALGFTSTFSRLVVGFVASHPSIGPDLMHVGMLGLCGLFTLSFPLYSSSFSGQLAFAALYGLYSGGLASVINIVILSLMDVRHIALAFGLICFGQGVASLAGPPISGAIVHAGGSYDDVFLFSGSLLLLAGFSGFPMVLCRPRPPPSPPEEEPNAEKAGESSPHVRIRMKGDNSHT